LLGSWHLANTDLVIGGVTYLPERRAELDALILKSD
jgi:hypothetical protein